jgi:hypothetical protein
LRPRLPQAATVAGKIVDDIRKLPLPKVRPVLTGGAPGDPVVCYSDVAGRFSFSGLSSGEYRLVMEKAGYATVSMTSIVGGGAVTDLADMVMVRKRTISGITWRLRTRSTYY